MKDSSMRWMEWVSREVALHWFWEAFNEISITEQKGGRIGGGHAQNGGLSLTPGLVVLSGMWGGQVASCERPWAAVHLGTVAYSGSKRTWVCCPCLVPWRHCPCLPITHLCSRAQFLLTFFSLLTRTRSPQARAAGPAHYFTPGHYLVQNRSVVLKLFTLRILLHSQKLFLIGCICQYLPD